MKLITEKGLNKYLNLTTRALKKVKIEKGLSKKDLERAKTYLEMSKNYLSDAKHFKREGNWVNAFAAVNYSHAWLDAGAISKLFDVGKDNIMFTVDSD
jgi:hypothetical protein